MLHEADRAGYIKTVAILDRAVAAFDATMKDAEPAEGAVALYWALRNEKPPDEICAIAAVAIIELIQIRRREMLPKI